MAKLRFHRVGTLKEDKPPNKGQAESTLVYTLYRKSPLKEDNLSTKWSRRCPYLLRGSTIMWIMCVLFMGYSSFQHFKLTNTVHTGKNFIMHYTIVFIMRSTPYLLTIFITSTPWQQYSPDELRRNFRHGLFFVIFCKCTLHAIRNYIAHARIMMLNPIKNSGVIRKCSKLNPPKISTITVYPPYSTYVQYYYQGLPVHFEVCHSGGPEWQRRWTWWALDVYPHPPPIG